VIKNGDILESVNGTSLGSPEATFALLPKLRDARQVMLIVNRGGERLAWELRID
jgi:type II secretory pathway component PulC